MLAVDITAHDNRRRNALDITFLEQDFPAPMGRIRREKERVERGTREGERERMVLGRGGEPGFVAKILDLHFG